MTYSVYNPCEDEITDPVCDPCLDTIEHGRVRGVAFINKNYYATVKGDPENAAVWNAGIANKGIYIIPETQGNFDGGQPVEVPGYGDSETKLIGYKFALGFKDPNYKGNEPFYNSIKGSSNWHIAFRTETQTRISGNPATIIPKSPVADDLNSEVVWDVEVKWSHKDQPTPFDTPADIFKCPL
jgi:hypothetical protein